MRLVCLFLLTLLAFAAPAQQATLPDLGDGGVVPAGQEYYLGRAWLMSFRRQVPLVNDPILQEYLEALVYRLAETSELKDRRLEIVIIDNASINAFAVPGGVVGVHNGLIAKSENEAQLASVLTHELAHISQRHFSRGVESRQNASVPTMAGLLGGLVLVATGAGDAGIATMMGTQAAVQQNQLRFSRQNEQEADRIGMQNLERSGMDPNATAGMFEVMQATSRRYGSNPPEFLLSHPLTENRIADARKRART
jgi:predicted Zn-dependent protease